MLLGFTRQEVKDNFAAHIEALRVAEGLQDTKETLEKLFALYNGYSWTDTRPEATVCNPFSVSMAFKLREFADYWNQQGASAWLPQVLSERPVINFGWQKQNFPLKFTLMRDGPDDFDATALLLQTGYLTVKEFDLEKGMRLDYANEEVKRGFEAIILPILERSVMPVDRSTLDNIERAVNAREPMKIMWYFDQHLRKIPYGRFPVHANVETNEAFFHNVLHDFLWFAT